MLRTSIPVIRPALWMLFSVIAGAGVARSTAAADRRIDFTHDIRPFLSNKCFACHGPDEAERKGGVDGLRLDSLAGATTDLGDGAKAVVPGDPAASRLIERVTSTDPDTRMPPDGFGKPLSAEEIELLRQWIAQGAEYAPHWAYIAPRRPETPAVSNGDWPRNPIDNFIVHRLLAEGLAPSVEADRAALIRRVTLDLTGLPPTPEEVDAFLADASPDAYEQLVDRLLASDAYGEHMARMWLDLARYGDSAGYADDPLRTIWGYRDWVIRAFNRNMPFDEFTIEQLAGDLLEQPTLDQLTATAFHRNTLTNSEGGTDDEEFRNVAVVDRVNTTMAVWMGTTMACAQCHTHKYDPITQHEYFQFFAFFNNTADADKKDESPTIEIFTDEQKQQRSDWEAELARLKEVTTTETPELRAARDRWIARFAQPLEWHTPSGQSASSRDGSGATVALDGLITVSQPAKQDVLAVTIPAAEAARTLTGLKLETPPGRNFVVTRVAATLVPPGSTSLPARFVRIELPGKQKMISLAEVQVFSGADNVARTGTATQSSTNYEGKPELAIDGNTNGDFFGAMSTTHTAQSKDPWWELDLGEQRPLDRLVIWNRTDGNLQSRLNGAVIQVLDADRKTVFEETLKDAPQTSAEFPLSGVRNIPFAAAVGDFTQDGFSAADVLASKSDPAKGWAVAPKQEEPHALVLIPKAATEVPVGWTVSLTIEQLSKFDDHTLPGVRVSETADPRAADQAGYPADVIALLSAPPAVDAASTRNDAAEARLSAFHLTIAPELAQERRQFVKVEKQLADLKPYTTIPVVRELAADQHRETRLQYRGNFLDKGDVVTAGLPAAFPSLPPDAPLDRLSLARWLVSRDNPLTARVTVNRLWEKVFGVGLVRTVEEFGSQGELPSHPELLDWLAVEFMDEHWDLQHILKLLVTSAAYRQSSVVSPELAARDPENRLLARGPRFRLTAEMVRDQSLAVAGLLSRKMYGAPVRPPQPSLGLNAAFGSSTDWEASLGEDRYRRAIYVQWRRSNPYPSMSAFDAPNREVCTLRRDRTNTPLQAFVTLNDPVYVEASQALGRRIAAQPGSVEEQLAWGFRLCLSRSPSAVELSRLCDLYVTSRERLQQNPAEAEKLASDPLGPAPQGSDPVSLAAWTVVGNVLLNLDEMLMKR
jgi:mono/diheme cytochrome c family protein